MYEFDGQQIPTEVGEKGFDPQTKKNTVLVKCCPEAECLWYWVFYLDENNIHHEGMFLQDFLKENAQIGCTIAFFQSILANVKRQDRGYQDVADEFTQRFHPAAFVGVLPQSGGPLPFSFS